MQLQNWSYVGNSIRPLLNVHSVQRQNVIPLNHNGHRHLNNLFAQGTVR